MRPRGKGDVRRLGFGVPETSASPSALSSPLSALAALRIPDFRRFIARLLAFTIAVQIQGTVVGWQMYELTHDKLALGMIGLAEALPFIDTSLFAWNVADRHDPRSITLLALGAELVPRELYRNTIAWRSGTWQLASVGGPAPYAASCSRWAGRRCRTRW